MKLNNEERLYIMQAMLKAIGDETKTQKHGNLRWEVEQEIASQIPEKAEKATISAEVFGEKVGTWSLRREPGKQEKSEHRFEIKNPADVIAWVQTQEAQEFAAKFAVNNSAKFAEAYFYETGEMPPGCFVNVVTVPATREHVKATLRVTPQKVAKALGAGLPEAVNQMLLDSGEEEDD